jgi:hypothetical protein
MRYNAAVTSTQGDPRGSRPALGAGPAFVLGWSAGLARLAAELLALRDGAAPGSPIAASAAACLPACGVHAALRDAMPHLPGAPPPPHDAGGLESYASIVRSWISSNLEPSSIVARAACVGLAGGDLVRASFLVSVLPDANVAGARFDPLERSRAAAADGLVHARLALGYPGTPAALAGIATSLAAPLAALGSPAAPFDFARHRALAHGLATSWCALPWSAPLHASLQPIPPDGGPWSSEPARPPTVAVSPPAPPAGRSAAGDAIDPLAATAPRAPRSVPAQPVDPLGVTAPRAPRRRLPPERRSLRETLVAFTAKQVQLDTALRALLEYDEWIVHQSLSIDPADVVDGRVKVDARLALLGPGDRPPADDAWIFTDERATAAIMEKVPHPGLGAHLCGRRGVETLDRIMTAPGIEKIRVNPGSPQEHTFFIERGSYGVVAMMSQCIRFERLATRPRDVAFRKALLALPGLATFRDAEQKMFTLEGDWAAPRFRPAVAFTTPDVARAFHERFTPEAQAQMKMVVPSPRTLIEVLLEDGIVDGLSINPFGPGAIDLDPGEMRAIVAEPKGAS